MFKKLFAAFAALTNNAQSLADAFKEADDLFRRKVGLDVKETPLLEQEEKPAKKNVVDKTT